MCQEKRRRQIWRSAIFGFAVGDALGAPAEFGERWMRDMDSVREMRSGGVFDVPVGGWTDDTSMVLATMKSLENEFNLRDMMERFVDWYRNGTYTWSGRAIGIGKQVLRALETYEVTRDMKNCGGSLESDNGNGSLMRILPVCLYGWEQVHTSRWARETAIANIHACSAMTHGHPRSQIACGLYYFLVSSVLDEKGTLKERLQKGMVLGFDFYKEDSELLYFDRLRNLSEFCRQERGDIRSAGYVVDTLEAAVWCLITTENFESALLKAVNLGLDTDTIAAVAGGLGGLYYGYECIPQKWMEALQNREMIEDAIAAQF